MCAFDMHNKKATYLLTYLHKSTEKTELCIIESMDSHGSTHPHEVYKCIMYINDMFIAHLWCINELFLTRVRGRKAEEGRRTFRDIMIYSFTCVHDVDLLLAEWYCKNMVGVSSWLHVINHTESRWKLARHWEGRVLPTAIIMQCLVWTWRCGPGARTVGTRS